MRPRLLVVAALCGGCASAHPTPVIPPAPEPTGAVSYHLLSAPTDSGASPPTDGEGRPQEFVPPTASPGNAPPAFPIAALAAACPADSVALRVVIDGHGGIGEVRPSPLATASRSECGELYRQAADAAIRRWSFAPAYRQTQLKPASEGPFGQPQWASETIPWFADFLFRFEIVDGRGTVTTPRWL